MSYYEGDVPYWVEAVAEDPSIAAGVVARLGKRLIEVAEENDRLLSDNLLLRRVQAVGQALDRLARVEGALDHLIGLLRDHPINVPVIDLLTANGRAAQIPLATLERGEDILLPGAPVALLAARRVDEMAWATTRGLLRRQYGFMLPLAEPGSPPKLERMGLERGAKVTCAGLLPHDGSNRYIIMISRGGQIAAGPKATMLQRAAADAPLIPGLAEDDEPVYLGAPVSSDDLLVATRLGRWLRFPVQRSLGQQTIPLAEGDQVACVTNISKDSTLYFIAENGEVLAAQEKLFAASESPTAKLKRLPGSVRPVACFAANSANSAAWIDHENMLRWQSLKNVFVNILLDDAKTRQIFRGTVRAICWLSAISDQRPALG